MLGEYSARYLFFERCRFPLCRVRERGSSSLSNAIYQVVLPVLATFTSVPFRGSALVLADWGLRRRIITSRSPDEMCHRFCSGLVLFYRKHGRFLAVQL